MLNERRAQIGAGVIGGDGAVMEGWRKVRLGDVADLNGGYAFKSTQYTTDGRFVLRTVNIRDDFSITKDGATFISEQEAAEYSRFGLQNQDTLFVMVAATLGKVGYVRPDVLPALLNQNMWVIRAKPGLVEPDFLQFCFRELSKIPLAWVSGSARSFLRRDDVRNLEFSLPPIPEQRAIAATLGALDDKIELNRRMNETLEAMARALFRDWFVDFGPTRAKMAGTAPYLSDDIWSLFPDRLDDDGKPEGWEFGNLGTIALARNQGVSPSNVHEDTPYIGLEHMPRGSIALNDWEGAGKVSSNKSAFDVGDFLFGKLRPYFHKVGIAPIAGICSTDIVVVRPRAPVWHGFVLACISDEDFVAYTDKTSTGTKMPRTNWSAMAKYQVVLPPKELGGAFNSTVSPMLDRIRANIQESRTLAQTRDLLLPRLMSGELRVAQAERALEEVL